MESDDMTLLEAWRGGDAASGRELVQRYFDAMYRFFANKLAGDVEDLIQETFTACVEGRDRFRKDASFRTYLYAIARNRLYRYWRDRKPEREAEESVQQMVESGPSPADALVARQEQRLLLRALRGLPLDLQVLLELAYFESLTDREVAVILEIPVGTLKSRLRRGRQLLQQAIEAADDPALVQTTTAGFDGWVASMRGRWQPSRSRVL
ncbi:MAG: sigma-70 family RNA polymerase sigma factor [Myxococcota bacterium]